jgi:TRAP-type mannitol/chloroaromatic compound transport system substrate-binding protein
MDERIGSKTTLARHDLDRRGLIKGSLVGGASLAAIGAGLARSAGAQQGQFRFHLQSFLGPGWMEWEQLIPRYIQRVREASGGAIEITAHPPGALVPTFDLLDAVSRGVVEMGYAAQVYWRGMLPFTQWTWGIPFYFDVLDHYDYLWWEAGLNDLTREAFATRNVFFLGPVYSDEWGSTIARVPINRLSDFEGLKIRSSGIGGEIWRSAGASIVTMPGEELYTGISTGVIDGANWGSPYGMVATRLHEVAKHYTGPSLIAFDAEDMFMNMDAYDALPPELQEGLVLATRVFALERASTSTYASAQAFQTLEEAGVTVTVLPEEDVEEIRRLTDELLPQLAEDDEYTKRTLDIIHETRDMFRRRPAGF